MAQEHREGAVVEAEVEVVKGCTGHWYREVELVGCGAVGGEYGHHVSPPDAVG